MNTLYEKWQKTEFEYLKTYSGLRGPKFDALKQDVAEKVMHLKDRLANARYMDQPKINKEILTLQNQVNEHISRVIEKNGGLHKSTVQISRLDKSDPFINTINALVSEEIEMEVASRCIPIFRDAIAFYGKHEDLKSIWHICFECAEIRDENEILLKTDYRIFDKLSNLLKSVGHEIA